MRDELVTKKYVDDSTKKLSNFVPVGYFNNSKGYMKIGVERGGDKATVLVHGISNNGTAIVVSLNITWDESQVYCESHSILNNVEVFYHEHEDKYAAVAFRITEGYCSYFVISSHPIYARYQLY